MTEKEWLGEDNQLGIDIWKNKYCYEGEDFEAWLGPYLRRRQRGH